MLIRAEVSELGTAFQMGIGVMRLNVEGKLEGKPGLCDGTIQPALEMGPAEMARLGQGHKGIPGRA